MPTTIKDGEGTSYLAHVDPEHRLNVYATVESEISHESEQNERGFTWTYSYDYSANDTILWLRNDDNDLNILIDRIVVASDVNTQFIVHFPEDTTPSGTSVTGTQLNRLSRFSADATAYGNETGNTRGTVDVQGITPANRTTVLFFDGSVILGTDNEIAVDFVTAGTLGMVTIRGYYHEVI